MTKTNNSENRNDLYTFTSQRALEIFFTKIFERHEIKKIIKRLKAEFKPRTDISTYLNNMQFLKKCEWELVRKAKLLKKQP